MQWSLSSHRKSPQNNIKTDEARQESRHQNRETAGLNEEQHLNTKKTNDKQDWIQRNYAFLKHTQTE